MNQPISKMSKILLAVMAVNCVLFAALYFIAAYFGFPIYIIYLLALAGFGLYYVICNRGFVGKNITPDMLPDTMSPAEKQAYIENCRHRLHSSRWVLTILFPILLSFALDIMYLFLLPLLKGIFS